MNPVGRAGPAGERVLPRSTACLLTVGALSLATLAGVFLVAPPSPVDGTPSPPCPPSPARVENESARFIPGQEAAVLQTPRWQLAGPGGRTVELTGVCHLADEAYYEDLNRHLRQFDAVLFEYPAEPAEVEVLQGKRPRPDPPPGEDGLVECFRLVAAALPGIRLQHDVMDYTAANFVHADLGPTETAARLEKLGLPAEEVFEAEVPDFAPDKIAADLEREVDQAAEGDPAVLKLMVAEWLAECAADDAETGAKDDATEDPSAQPEETRHIDDLREDEVIRVLERETAAGKRRLAVLYGSAHAPGLKKRLLARGWKVTGVTWHDAWRIETRIDGP